MKKIIRIILFTVLLFLPFHGTITDWINLPVAAYWKELLLACTLYLFVISMLLEGRVGDSLSGRKNFFVFVFFFWVVMCSLLHPQKTSLWGLAGYTVYIVFYFMFLGSMQKRHVYLVVKALLLIGFVLAVGAIVQSSISPTLFGLLAPDWLPDGQVIRAGSFVRGPNVLGGYLALLAPVAVGFYLTKSKKSHIIFYLVITFSLLIGVALTFSRRSWIQLFFSLASFLMILFFWDRRNSRVVLCRLFIIIACGLILFSMSNAFNSTKSKSLGDVLSKRFISSFDYKNNYQDMIRLQRMKITLSFLSTRTILIGMGPGSGSFFGTYDAMSESPLLQELSKKTPGTASIESYYLQILVELGFFGLAAFICLYLQFILTGIRGAAVFINRDNQDGILLASVTAGLIGFIPVADLCTWVISSVFWTYCAIITILARGLHANIQSHKQLTSNLANERIYLCE